MSNTFHPPYVGKIKKGWQIALLVIAGILTVTGVGLGIAVGVVVYSKWAMYTDLLSYRN